MLHMAPLDRRAFETLHPERRISIELPVSEHETVRITVLDSPTEMKQVFCAAMLVPKGSEGDWMYNSEGGQWQLLATTGVSRMIIVDRISGVPDSRVSKKTLCWQCEDEALKRRLVSVVVALAPRVCFRSGIPTVPFLDYSNDVVHRVVVVEVCSSVTGSMVVEDVALDEEVFESKSLGTISLENECPHGRPRTGCRKLAYRRRLRFKRTPNLIQTEVALVDRRNSGMKIGKEAEAGIGRESVGAYCEEIMRDLEIDHSFLVHSYLPPIVAGLVLASSCIEPCMERGEKAKMLALGVGGGALPIFMQKYLGFNVRAVDVDNVVIDVARRHFGLQNGNGMEVEVGDAVQIVGKLAMVIAEDARQMSHKSAFVSLKSREALFVRGISEDDRVLRSGTQVAVASSRECIHDVRDVNERMRNFDDHRVHVIVVDVDEGDALCGLSSPPSSFLEHDFLSAARSLLHDGGVLAMNVVPNGANSHSGVISSLLSVFDDVYEIAVDKGVNRIVFALSCKVEGVNLGGPLGTLVKSFVDVRLISGIQRAHTES